MSQSTASEDMVPNSLLLAEKDARLKVQSQLDICTWVLIALMRKHRYKQFPVPKTLLIAIAEAEMDLHCDDESVPGQLIITIDPKVKVDVEESGPSEEAVCEADGDGDAADPDSGSPAPDEPGLHQGSSDSGPESDD
jgi:hypothetical protein